MESANNCCLNCMYSRFYNTFGEYICLKSGNDIYDPFSICEKWRDQGEDYDQETDQ